MKNASINPFRIERYWKNPLTNFPNARISTIPESDSTINLYLMYNHEY